MLKPCLIFDTTIKIRNCVSNYLKLWIRPIRALNTSQVTDNQSNSFDLSNFPVERIRNFSIIAHIDHGKSTLADRLLEITGTVSKEASKPQFLDKLQVERERGITVKAQTATLVYSHQGQEYLLNLIDTPGHVDFSFEVARSLAACQGVILLVDANQGVQAQTLANFYLAFARDLVVVPVLNKIDLKNANPEVVAEQMKNLFDIDPADILKVSAKTGLNVTSVLDAIITRIPPPSHCDTGKPFRALLFDSWYDRYKGAIALTAVIDGSVKNGDQISSLHSGKTYEVKEVGVLRPNETPVKQILAGQVGYLVCNMRTTREAKVGDTLHQAKCQVEPVTAFAPAKPMVFAGVYPMDQSETPALRSAIEKLTLNDSSVTVNIDSSPALGQGWRLGFLGLLHMEVFNQRLEQEYGAEVVVTAPSVPYQVRLKGEKNIKKYGSAEITITSPSHLPDPTIIEEIREPMVNGMILTPDDFVGPIIGLCMERRGIQKEAKNVDGRRIMLSFKLPLNEIALDFYDQLKSLSSGYASFDYEESGYETSNLVKMDVLLNGLRVEELSSIVHAARARDYGKIICARLKDTIPKQLFQVAVQAAVGSKILARENIAALRKDVTAKCYGGDITRKMKLLKRQAEGKKRMKSIANIDVPRETFIAVLKR